MDRTSYGATAAIISKITDPNQLDQMMRDPRYAGYTNVIVARLNEIKQMQAAAQAKQPQPPTVAQQVMQPPAQQQAAPQQQALQQGYAEGGGIRGFSNNGWARNRNAPVSTGMRVIDGRMRPVGPVAPKPVPLTPAQVATNTFNNQVSAAQQQDTAQNSASAPQAPQNVPVGQAPNMQSQNMLAQPQQPQAPQMSQAQQAGQQPQMLNNRMSANMVAPPVPVSHMASGGIVAFKHGGKVRKFATGGDPTATDGGGTPAGYVTLPDGTKVPYTYPTAGMPGSQSPQAGMTGEVVPTSMSPLDLIMRGRSPFNPSVPAKPAEAKAIVAAAKNSDGAKTDTPAAPVRRDPTAYAHVTPNDMFSAGYGVSPRNVVDAPQDFATLYKQASGAINGNINDPNSLAYSNARDREQIALDANRAPWMGLMQTGLGMASEAGKHPWEGAFGNFATAASDKGLPLYMQQNDEAKKQDLALTQEQRKQNQALGIMSTQEASAQQRANAMANRAEQHDRMMMGMQNKPFMMQENNIRDYAKMLSQQPGNTKSDQENLMIARAAMAGATSPYNASLTGREALSSQGAEQKAGQDAYDMELKNGSGDATKAAAARVRAVMQYRELYGSTNGGATPAGGNIVGKHPDA